VGSLCNIKRIVLLGNKNWNIDEVESLHPCKLGIANSHQAILVVQPKTNTGIVEQKTPPLFGRSIHKLPIPKRDWNGLWHYFN